ncbi:ATP-binding cassette domain-containing protein [Georgenia sp. SUBG003]|uniref:ATP-binding cassette domain-containing protein n=1 Tax=Georgenia sp. SUBG003 TaxID=1497974 RepID=UPI003AB84851
MTVLENMLVAVQPRTLGEYLGGSRSPSTVRRAREMLARVGIDHLENSEARDISYGQQKLLELGSTLMSDPPFVMLDEPAGGVNPSLIERIAVLIRELNEEGTTFLIGRRRPTRTSSPRPGSPARTPCAPGTHTIGRRHPHHLFSSRCCVDPLETAPSFRQRDLTARCPTPPPTRRGSFKKRLKEKLTSRGEVDISRGRGWGAGRTPEGPRRRE